jgi:hypothetical protein
MSSVVMSILNPTPGPSASVTALGVIGLDIGSSVGPLTGPSPSASMVGLIEFLIENGSDFDTSAVSALLVASPSQTVVGPFTVLITNNT